MAIQKQEFYEGAAIRRLICGGGLKSVAFDPPFFSFNGLPVYLKYSTKTRTPWGFTFTPEEFRLLRARARQGRVVVGLVCGVDGIAAVECDQLLEIGVAKESAVRIACFRKHNEYYRVSGPDGELKQKVPPSDWVRLLGSQ